MTANKRIKKRGIKNDYKSHEYSYRYQNCQCEKCRSKRNFSERIEFAHDRITKLEIEDANKNTQIKEIKDLNLENFNLFQNLQTGVNKVEEKENQLEKRTEKLENKVFPVKKPPKTIYDFNTIYHWIGWPIFLILAGYIGKKVYRAKNRKAKVTKNYLAEIRAIFKEWKLNMYASTAAYVAGFYLIKEAIEKWVNPRISNWLATQKAITISVVCLFVGIGFYLDGLITSSLKTPLQRLGIRIENSDIDEKVKKDLISKTQKVNELFKETLKRFGLLAVVGILTYLIREYWNKHILSYLSYAVPIAGAIKIIWDVDKTLKKIKLDNRGGNIS